MTTAQPPLSPRPTPGGGPAASTGEADLAGPVLAVYAHPDDETLQAGALLALAAAQHRRVVVVTATRGERGELIGSPQLEGSDAVAPLRARELDAALAALGVSEHHWLDDLAQSGAEPTTQPSSPAAARWTDSGMAWVGPGQAGPAPDAGPDALTAGDLEQQAGALAALVRELRPTLVVCDEPGGSYGHPDHIRTHRLTVAALERALLPDGDAPGWRVPVLGWVVQEETRLRAARAQVSALLAETGAAGWDGRALVEPEAALPSLTRERCDISLELDATGVLHRVVAALHCYPSQVQAVTVPVLDSGAPADRALLAADQAAVGWYALSNDIAQPILPVVALQLDRGTAAQVGLAGMAAPAATRAGAGGAVGGGTVGRMRPLSTAQLVLRGVGGLLLGVLAGAVGTLVHRVRPWELPAGLVLATALVVFGGVLARSAGRGAALLGYGVGVIGTVQLLAFGSSTNVLVPGDWRGLTWLLLSAVSIAVVAFLPRRWVGEPELPPVRR